MNNSILLGRTRGYETKRNPLRSVLCPLFVFTNLMNIQRKGENMAEELNIRQDRFLKALLESPSIEQACKMAGINKTTGYKYLKDERFMSQYRKLRRDAMQQVTARLQKVSEEAVDVLREVMNDQDASPSARVQSAKNVLDIAYRSIELDDIQGQLEELQRVVGDRE